MLVGSGFLLLESTSCYENTPIDHRCFDICLGNFSLQEPTPQADPPAQYPDRLCSCLESVCFETASNSHPGLGRSIELLSLRPLHLVYTLRLVFVTFSRFGQG